LSFVFFIWPLYCLLWVNVCPLSFSFDNCIVCYGSLFVHCLFHLTIVLSVMGQCLSFFFFIWPLYCLLWVIVCPLSFSFDHCIVCYGSFNTMVKWKRQRTNIDPLQTIQWSNEKDNGQTLTHNRQYNGQMKKTKDKHWPITDNTKVKWKRQRTNIDP
jgi:hypothetical protein